MYIALILFCQVQYQERDLAMPLIHYSCDKTIHYWNSKGKIRAQSRKERKEKKGKEGKGGKEERKERKRRGKKGSTVTEWI